MKKTKKIIDPLPPVDLSEVEFEPFDRDFYVEHPDIAALDDPRVATLRDTLGVHVSGYSPARPVCSFAHFSFPEKLVELIVRAAFKEPTPIQAQVRYCAY